MLYRVALRGDVTDGGYTQGTRSLFFFFNDPAPPEIYTLSLHDALPIWSCRPLVECVLLDDEPHLFEAAFDFLLGADQPCQCRIASSMRGYVPQRQMLPAI